MIILTNPIPKSASLGGSPTALQFDKIVYGLIRIDVDQGILDARVQATAQNDPSGLTYEGKLAINGAQLTINLERLGVLVNRTLSAGEQAWVTAYITAAQNDLEGGTVNNGAVDGVQSPGV